QTGDGLVGGLGHRRQFFLDVGVVVPVLRRPTGPAPDLDETHTPLDQSAGGEALAAEDLGRLLVHAGELRGRLRLAGEVQGVGYGELHLGGELVGGDAGFEPRVARVAGGVLLVHFAQQSETVPLARRGDVLRILRREQIGDGVGGRRVEDGALVLHGQEAGG